MMIAVWTRTDESVRGQVPDSYKRSMSRGIGLFFVSPNSIFIFFLFRQKDVLFEKDQKVCSFLLTSEEKEPKKTVTPKAPYIGGCNRSYSSLFH